MNKAEKAGMTIRAMDDLAMLDSPVHAMDPLCKLLLTVAYIFIVVSFHKYDIFHLFVMILFPLAGYALSLIPVSTCFYRLRIVMPLVMAVGIVNPFLDKEILMTIGNVRISGGVISMLTLMMKGIFSLMMSFLLIATTSIDKICRALRRIHFPKILTMLILLTYRYISVLLDEVAIMTDAYHLRAPGQKGIQFKAWGSFLGQLLLRTMDRAEELYNSMLLRGFDGDFHYSEQKNDSWFSWVIVVLLLLVMVYIRFGRMIMSLL